MPAKWQLAQMFLGAGCHLPKRVRKMREMYVAPIDDSWIKNSRGPGSGFRGARGYSFASYCNLFEHMIPYGRYHNRVYIGSRISGNLPLEEYRFYLGHSVAISEFSQCRVCLKILCGQKERAEHSASQGCCGLFTTAIKTIKAFGLCLVCGEDKPSEKWGVPLCNPEHGSLCQQLWMVEVCQPLALRQAILEVRTRKAEMQCKK